MNQAIAIPISKYPSPKSLSIVRKVRQISSDAIRAEVSKILQSIGFLHARRMQRFLQFVVEETLTGRADQLCEYNIGISVFDRDEAFEPGIDPIVRNDARRLRHKLLEYYQHPSDGRERRVVIQIPKGGYVPVFTESCPKAARQDQQYRLMMSLIRIADGAEIWAAQKDLHFG